MEEAEAVSARVMAVDPAERASKMAVSMGTILEISS